METLTATRDEGKHGVWHFICPLHFGGCLKFSKVSTPIQAIETLKNHMDADHPGIKVRIKVTGSHVIHSTYAGIATIQTGDML
jgi:hypothetical protein